jgi:hypothetical protein
MNERIIERVRHILTARIDNAQTQDAYIAYCNARDIFEYALAENEECLKEFDYLLTAEEL